jgi:hypothetical protein
MTPYTRDTKSLEVLVSAAGAESIFAEIDVWFERAPSGMDEGEALRWVQGNADILCPRCDDVLWVTRSTRAQNRGYYHLAMCQNAECSFQIDD